VGTDEQHKSACGAPETAEPTTGRAGGLSELRGGRTGCSDDACCSAWGGVGGDDACCSSCGRGGDGDLRNVGRRVRGLLAAPSATSLVTAASSGRCGSCATVAAAVAAAVSAAVAAAILDAVLAAIATAVTDASAPCLAARTSARAASSSSSASANACGVVDAGVLSALSARAALWLALNPFIRWPAVEEP
jgi:hypothetical protein